MNSNKLKDLLSQQFTWLVSGCAGFIGSNLTEYLLLNNQKVVGIDNFSTGKLRNLDEIKSVVGENWCNFTFVEGDVNSVDSCRQVTQGVDFVLHQAALGSVPRSIDNPLTSHNNNVNGHLNMLCAAKDAGVKKFVYASSSAVYGDHPVLPKVEDNIGQALSPYAVTKQVNELYAKVFYKTYGLQTIGIRYFNVFGKRQDPDSIYAAVMPKWIKAMIDNEAVHIFGDGTTSRDFCYIQNVVQMNVLAALSNNEKTFGEVFNCGCADRTDLKTLFSYIRDGLAKYQPTVAQANAQYGDFRVGDVKHSHADIAKACKLLNYRPTHMIKSGLDESLQWYYLNLKSG